MQGIYNYVPETNQLQFMTQAMLLSLLNVLCFYIRTSQRRPAVPSRAVFCSYYYYYHHHHNHYHYCKLQVRYSYSLRYGRSWDRIPLRGYIFRTRPNRPWGLPSFLYVPWVQVLFPGDEAAGAWQWSCTPSRAEVKGRVQLYPYHHPPSGPSRQVIWWNLFFTLDVRGRFIRKIFLLTRVSILI